MTDIRTISDLQQRMSDEFTWRKKELHAIKSQVQLNEKTRMRDMCIRSAIALLYAHWEGLVKSISRDYLDFVKMQRIKNRELSRILLDVSVSKLVRQATGGNRIQPCLDVVDFFSSQMESRTKVDLASAINTKSNLKSDVFKEIVIILGLDYSIFATKEKLLDQKLLAHRNGIAHGQYLDVDYKEYLDLHVEMVSIMQEFYDQVENSAILGLFRGVPQTLP